MEFIRRKYQTESGRWLFAVLMAVACMLVTDLCFPVLFATNDDTRIMYALAGYASGTPYPGQQFINLVLGQIISGLYEIQPAIPWYTVYHILLIGFSLVLIFKSVLKAFVCCGISAFQATAACLMLYCVFFLYPTFMMQFTTTAALGAVGAVAVMMVWQMPGDHLAARITDGICMVLALMMGFILRAYSVYSVLCFFALAAVYRVAMAFLKDRRACKKVLLQTAVVAVSFLLLLAGARWYSSSVKLADPRNVAYNDYNQYRVAYQDFPSVDYYSNLELYQSIGWGTDIFNASRKLIYLDERFNAENLQVLTEGFSLAGLTANRSLGDAAKSAHKLVSTNSTARIILVAMVVIGLADLVVWLIHPHKKSKLLTLLCILCTVGGFAVMMVYLCYNGRFPLRTLQTIAFPAAVMMVIAIPFLQGEPNGEKAPWKCGKIFAVLCICLAGLQLFMTVTDLKRLQKPATLTSATMEQVRDFEEYAISHPDRVYVYDFTVATLQRDPFRVITGDKPSNCIIAGGSYVYSALYYDQLAALGRDSLTWADMCDPDVYYVTCDMDFLETVKANTERVLGGPVEYVQEAFLGDVYGVSVFKLYQPG